MRRAKGTIIPVIIFIIIIPVIVEGRKKAGISRQQKSSGQVQFLFPRLRKSLILTLMQRPSPQI